MPIELAGLEPDPELPAGPILKAVTVIMLALCVRCAQRTPAFVDAFAPCCDMAVAIFNSRMKLGERFEIKPPPSVVPSVGLNPASRRPGAG